MKNVDNSGRPLNNVFEFVAVGGITIEAFGGKGVFFFINIFCLSGGRVFIFSLLSWGGPSRYSRKRVSFFLGIVPTNLPTHPRS